MSEPTNDQPESQPTPPVQPPVPPAPEVSAPPVVEPQAPAAPEYAAPAVPQAPAAPAAPEAPAAYAAPEAPASIPDQPAQYAAPAQPVPPAYQAPQAAQYAPPIPPAPPVPPVPQYAGQAATQANGSKALAIIALVLGILAFLTGFVPVVGIVFGAGAVGLGIAALVQRQSKGLAIPGLALGAVGLLASLLMTFIFGSFMSAFENSSTSLLESSEYAESDPYDYDEDPFAEERETENTGPGSTRENPLALGKKIESNDWDVVIDSVNLDADALVAAENPYNDPPADGHKYIMVSATATYKGEDSGYPGEVRIEYVSAEGKVYSWSDSVVVAPEPSFGYEELYTGASSTGNLVISVPKALDGVLRVQPGYIDEKKTFVAIK